MPTKKGSSKASKGKKASNQQRKSPKRGVRARTGATRRVSTGRVTATGAGAGMSRKSNAGDQKGNDAGRQFTPGSTPGPEGSPDRKATGEGSERVRL